MANNFNTAEVETFRLTAQLIIPLKKEYHGFMFDKLLRSEDINQGLKSVVGLAYLNFSPSLPEYDRRKQYLSSNGVTISPKEDQILSNFLRTILPIFQQYPLREVSKKLGYPDDIHNISKYMTAKDLKSLDDPLIKSFLDMRKQMNEEIRKAL